MISKLPDTTIGLLFSGGLDSAIMLGHLLDSSHHVQPFYIRSNVYWQREELSAAVQLIDSLSQRTWTDGAEVRPLVILDLPLDDLYGDHWSINGRRTPQDDTPDEAVFMPGRNPLLVIKAALWCGLNQIDRLALAPLAANPFADSSDAFFTAYESALNRAIPDGDTCLPVRLVRPFARMTKREVMQLGSGLPLQFTFSCIRPCNGLHCGRCNKCAERRSAFAEAERSDPTKYKSGPSGHTI
jgi:7-cyano-7-deazaguanine synthase